MKRFTAISLFVLAAALVFGLVRLFQWRFETGDVYPGYSSLRADPLGAKAFHASLESLLAARRNYRPLTKLAAQSNATVLFLGLAPNDLEWHPADLEAVESMVRAGGRLIIAMFPSYEGSAVPGFRTAAPKLTEEEPAVPLTKAWDFSLGHAPVRQDTSGVYQPGTAGLQAGYLEKGLPDTLKVYTALCFTNAADHWKPVYERRRACPVILERQLGSGTIVLAADSYYFSNEALLKDRQPELLSWFVGGSSVVIFDETHLGVTETPGVAALVRKYHLHGLFAGLLLLAVLFVWKSGASLIPRHPTRPPEVEPDVLLGRDSAAGFVNLLRRSIRKHDLLAVCLKQWRAACAPRTSRSRLEAIQRIIDAANAGEEPDSLRVYREISQVLKRRR